MEDSDQLSLEQIRAFLEASSEVGFQAEDRAELYGWVDQTLRHHNYLQLARSAKGLVRRYVAKMTGLSRAQTARLIRRHKQGLEVKPKAYRRRRFPSRYTQADVELLAAVDNAHETLSGPATQKLLQRALHDYGDQRFQRLATISVAQIYRLRKTLRYRARHAKYQHTRPTTVAIGERRKPDPQGRPGYLRVDTVHQGDLEGVKGLYHINAVDEVTQWQVVGAAPYISEAWLMPVLEAMLQQFPFRIRGFHSDNGSEFINSTVSQLLNKLLIEQTKSRPRHSNDNGLAETKNGWVIRKHIGWGHITSQHAEAFDQFYRNHFNPYLNFHRPCGVPELRTNAKGKQKRIYRWYATPWEILRQLPGLASHLRPDLTLEKLAQQARLRNDLQAALDMQTAKQKLFASLRRKRTA
jgi:transposase InsO family protein